MRRLVLLLASLAALPAVQAGKVDPPVEAGGTYSVPVTSMKELRFRGTTRQQYDFSCGSAALATLLTSHYGFPVSEEDVFKEMYARGDKDKIRREGFSLLDIKLFLEARGFTADGFIADLDRLNVAGIPAIALVNEKGYNHFVVIKGLKDGRVLVGDPSTGTRVIPRTRFEAMWSSGILFVVSNRSERARFNSDSDWRSAPRAPLAQSMNRGALDALLMRRGNWDF